MKRLKFKKLGHRGLKFIGWYLTRKIKKAVRRNMLKIKNPSKLEEHRKISQLPVTYKLLYQTGFNNYCLTGQVCVCVDVCIK